MKRMTTPNFFGVHNDTFLRSIPYRTHGKCVFIGMPCVIARGTEHGDWAVLDIESGIRFGNAYTSKSDAVAQAKILETSLTAEQIARGMNQRARTIAKTKRLERLK